MTMVNGSSTGPEGAEPTGARRDVHEVVEALAEQTLAHTTKSDPQTASRIIIAANDAAERLLADARTEATTVVETAKKQSVELLAVARKLADTELAAERVRVNEAVGSWTTMRNQIVDQLEGLQSTLDAYRSDAEATIATVSGVLADLTKLVPEGSPEVAPAPVATPAPVHAMGPAAAPTPSADEPSSAADAEPAEVPSKRTTLFGGPTSAPEAAPEPARSGLFGR